MAEFLGQGRSRLNLGSSYSLGVSGSGQRVHGRSRVMGSGCLWVPAIRWRGWPAEPARRASWCPHAFCVLPLARPCPRRGGIMFLRIRFRGNRYGFTRCLTTHVSSSPGRSPGDEASEVSFYGLAQRNSIHSDGSLECVNVNHSRLGPRARWASPLNKAPQKRKVSLSAPYTLCPSPLLHTPTTPPS